MKDETVPIIVVTISSMADHSPMRLRIETFARLLFDQWEIGDAEIDGREWNRGILLLISKNDRQARIELGNGWRREKDPQCQQIMKSTIIPHFKRNDYSGGILAGVKALDDMVRGRTHPGQAGLPGAGGVRPVLPHKGRWRSTLRRQTSSTTGSRRRVGSPWPPMACRWRSCCSSASLS